MSDTDEEEIDEVPPDDDGDDEGEGRPKKRGRKRLIILIAAPLLVIILLVVGAVVMGIGPFGGGAEEEVAAEESHGGEAGGEHGAEGAHGEGGAGHVGFYELPQMTVNLNTTDGTTSFLRLTVSLELANDTPETRAQLDAMLPRVIDNFQVYMRELRLDDLSGSAGLFRLKQELLSRTNRAVDPVKVSDVLFSELLVQ
ncbi:MAG: flagellar basal body-associated FliL family protein [Alphaproteobacteria bacterium]